MLHVFLPPLATPLPSGDTYSADRLRRLAKEMLVENSKKLELITDWKTKLAARTELVLEVLEELAKNSL